jgi:hypothetical protein
MPVLSDYVAGTITLTNGSPAFTGSGTGWRSAGFREGDTIFDVTGATEYTGVIASISGEGAGTLTKAWEGPTVTAAYRMRYQADGSRATAQARAIAEQFAVVEANGRGLFFRFSDSVADADPSPGYLRLNNPDPAAATATYIDNLDASGASVSGEIDTWDDGGSTIKGRLWLRSIVTASAFRSYNVTGSVVDGTGYRKLTLAHVGGSGVFTADDGLMVFFAPKGDAGEGGLSAYQVALANGFVGSEAAWLGSLEGGDGINGVDGKFSGTETIKTSAYTALAADSGKTIILNKATTDTLSFDAVANLGSTWMVMVKNIGAGTWTLDPSGAELIDGLASVSLAQNESVVVSCNGTRLRTLFRGSAPAVAVSSEQLARNGSFAVAKRAMPTADNSYCLDGWRLLLENANGAIVSQDSSDVPPGAGYACKLVVGSGNNGKFGVLSVIESLDSIPLRSGGCSLRVPLKATAGLTDGSGKIRIAILAFTGTADATTSDPISSWGSEGTNPTLATNWSYCNSPAAIAVTTSWVDYLLENASIPSNANNIAILIWSDDRTNAATTDILRIGGGVTLVKGITCPVSIVLPIAEEEMRCRRYFRDRFFAIGIAYDTTHVQMQGEFNPPMRATPTFGTPSGSIDHVSIANRTVSAAPSVVASDRFGANVNYTVSATTNGALHIAGALLVQPLSADL